MIKALSGERVVKQGGYVRVTDLALHARQVVPGRTRDRQHPILHFEHVDSLVLAYYAGGDEQPKGLPFDVEPEIESELGAWQSVAFERRRQAVRSTKTNIDGGMQGPVLLSYYVGEERTSSTLPIHSGYHWA